MGLMLGKVSLLCCNRAQPYTLSGHIYRIIITYKIMCDVLLVRILLVYY